MTDIMDMRFAASVEVFRQVRDEVLPQWNAVRGASGICWVFFSVEALRTILAVADFP
jgi:hypothetical protein